MMFLSTYIQYIYLKYKYIYLYSTYLHRHDYPHTKLKENSQIYILSYNKILKFFVDNDKHGSYLYGSIYLFIYLHDKFKASTWLNAFCQADNNIIFYNLLKTQFYKNTIQLKFNS